MTNDPGVSLEHDGEEKDARSTESDASDAAVRLGLVLAHEVEPKIRDRSLRRCGTAPSGLL